MMMMNHNVQRAVGIIAGILRCLSCSSSTAGHSGRSVGHIWHSTTEIGIGSAESTHIHCIDELGNTSRLRLWLLLHCLEALEGHKLGLQVLRRLQHWHLGAGSNVWWSHLIRGGRSTNLEHLLGLLNWHLCLLLMLTLLILHQYLLLQQLEEGRVANEDGGIEPRQGLGLLVDLLLIHRSHIAVIIPGESTVGQGWHGDIACAANSGEIGTGR